MNLDTLGQTNHIEGNTPLEYYLRIDNEGYIAGHQFQKTTIDISIMLIQ